MERKRSLSSLITLAALPLMLLGMGSVLGQIAGSTTIGINAEEMKAVAIGWSATRQILGTPVYTDAEANQKVLYSPEQNGEALASGVAGAAL